MPNATACDRAAEDFRFRHRLLAELRTDFSMHGCEGRSTWDLVGLVVEQRAKKVRATRDLMGAPSGR